MHSLKRPNTLPSILSAMRSEERRVGKSVDLGGWRNIKKKKQHRWRGASSSAAGPLALNAQLSQAAATHAQSMAFFFQAEDGIRDLTVTGVQTCALPISVRFPKRRHRAWHSQDNCSECTA